MIISLKSFSQNRNDELILKKIFGADSVPEVAYATESKGYDKIEEIISRKIIFSRTATGDTIRLKLSQQEIENVKKEIQNSKNFIFPIKLFPNTHGIAKDKMDSYVANKRKIWTTNYHAALKSGDTAKINKFRKENGYSHETYVHFLSKPIYLRNETLCIIYDAKLCNLDQGVGGCQQVLFYQKNEDTWSKLFGITIGCY